MNISIGNYLQIHLCTITYGYIDR